GSNKQRQSVPLIQTEAPLVGTGMEAIVARDSGYVVLAQRPGVVESVDATRIVVKTDLKRKEPGSKKHEICMDTYDMVKFKRSNQKTNITQKPVVKVGQKVKR